MICATRAIDPARAPRTRVLYGSEIFGIGMFVFISITFALRMNKQEKIMLELFPKQYPEYQ